MSSWRVTEGEGWWLKLGDIPLESKYKRNFIRCWPSDVFSLTEAGLAWRWNNLRNLLMVVFSTPFLRYNWQSSIVRFIESPKYLPNTVNMFSMAIPVNSPGNLAASRISWMDEIHSLNLPRDRETGPFLGWGWGGGGKNYIACIHGPLGEGCEGGCRVNDGYAVCVHQKTVNHITIIHYLRFFDSVFQPSCHPHTHLPPSPSPGKISQLSWECRRFSWSIFDNQLFQPLDKS